MTTQAPTESILTSTISEPKLWAGKYKSPEDMEEAYKKVASTFEENRDLKAKIEQQSRAPDEYIIPENVTLREHEINEIKQLSKNAGLTQEHFERVVKDMHGKIQSQLQGFEQAKQEVGEERMNLLKDYVEKNYPETLRETVLNKLIKDKDAMADALDHRNKTLNSSVPGMSSGSTAVPQKYDGEAELHKAAIEYKKRPTESNKNKYIDLARQVGEARGLGRK